MDSKTTSSLINLGILGALGFGAYLFLKKNPNFIQNIMNPAAAQQAAAAAKAGGGSSGSGGSSIASDLGIAALGISALTNLGDLFSGGGGAAASGGTAVDLTDPAMNPGTAVDLNNPIADTPPDLGTVDIIDPGTTVDLTSDIPV
jgi:hypothetical protein